MRKINYTLNQKLICIAIGVILFGGCNSGGTSVSHPGSAGTQYYSFNCPGSDNVSFPGVSGVRQVTGSSDVYVTGVYVQYGSPHAFLYRGPVLGGGTCSAFNYPTSIESEITVTSTSLYGPDNASGGNVVVVGSYTTSQGGVYQQFGLLYQGAGDGSTTSGYTTLNPQALVTESVVNTLGHSTMNGLVVGNYDTAPSNGKAFLYDINTESYTAITIGLVSTTAYGIWWNGGESYTITGGYSDVNESGIDIGYLIDYDNTSHTFYNFESYNYHDLPASVAGTHFEGITSDGNGGYNLSADWQYAESTASPVFVHVPRIAGGGFGVATWTDFMFPGSSVTSANTVYQNYVLGLYQISGQTLNYGYVAAIK